MFEGFALNKGWNVPEIMARSDHNSDNKLVSTETIIGLGKWVVYARSNSLKWHSTAIFINSFRIPSVFFLNFYPTWHPIVN